MRLDIALVITIVAMVFLVAVGYPVLAILAGLLGVLFIGASGERYQKFEDVGVPKAGDYPKWDFWKDLVSDTGTFLGKLSKTFLRTEQPVDQWSDFMKKTVYGDSSDTGIYMYGPFGMVLPKSFAKDMHKMSQVSVLYQQLSQISALEKTLIDALNQAPPDQRDKIKEQLEALQKAKNNLLKYAADLLKNE